MALGTPTAAAVAYSASGGTSVAPSYPTGLVSGDVIVMFVGQKPTTANGGTVTTPTGWTLQDSLTAAGGYGTTTGADVGNTNLYVYTKDTVTGSETGTLSVTVGGNNVCWAFMIRVPVGNGTISYGTADGQRTTTPTSPMSIALTNGASATNFQAGDLALWAMVIPTDVTTPSQFSAESITATGATFGTAVEFNEPDSTTGNDIGGYSAYASVSSGSSTTAPTVTATITGTLTNVRGPVVLLRVRETAPPSQDLAPSLYTETNDFFGPTVDATNTVAPDLYTNTNAFYDPTVVPGAIDLQPVLYANANDFYSAVITTGGETQSLSADLYSNSNTFYAATLSASNAITASRLDNSSTFYAASISAANSLTAARFDNANTFYAATINQAGGPQSLTADLYTNTNAFYAASANNLNTLSPSRYDNSVAFYSASISATASIEPGLYTNTGTIYTPIITATAYTITFPDYFASDYVGSGYVGLALQSENTFYPVTLVYDQVVEPAVFTNTNTFFAPTVSRAGDAVHVAGTVKKSPFKQAKLIEFPENEQADAAAIITALDASLELSQLKATGETVISANARILADVISAETFSFRAFSSWNDPTEEELIAILEIMA